MDTDKAMGKAIIGGLILGVVTGIAFGPTVTGYTISMVGGAAWGFYCGWEELDQETKTFLKHMATKRFKKLVANKSPFRKTTRLYVVP